MDDLTEKLSAVLNNPAEMEKIRALAGSFLKEESPAANKDEMPDISKLLPMLKKISACSDDNRVKLLMALKPYLSEKRREKTDKAVKILKAAAVVPLLNETGIF